jgi:adenylyltransferase/sulfurtransferase
LDQPSPFILLDVREPSEIEIGNIEQSIFIPLGDLSERIGELDPGAEIVVLCKTGGRSAKALSILNESGFTNACHVKGGISAWAEDIDSTIEVL